MRSLVFAMPGNEKLATSIAKGITADLGEFTLHQFPDGESYVRVLSEVKDLDIFVVCTLNNPNEKILPLLFLCKVLRDLNAKSICLVVPYLSYMRQDIRFKSGEAVTSEYFGPLLSSFLDRLITIDPHLHRRVSMNEIYSIPCNVLHAADSIASWIKQNVPNALLVGPDIESEQWVSKVAKQANADFIVLEKIRHGDKDVEVSVPNVTSYKNHTPILVDDIISTAHTMIETVKHLQKAGMKAPICIGVHAVFAGNAYKDLLAAGVKEIITCNTIEHQSNKIEISELIINALNTKH